MARQKEPQTGTQLILTSYLKGRGLCPYILFGGLGLTQGN